MVSMKLEFRSERYELRILFFWNADETGPLSGALMKRIFFVCVEGFAKAKGDGDGFSLRLKTATENLFCFKLLERG